MTAHCSWAGRPGPTTFPPTTADGARASGRRDRKSTRLNSSHSQISYAVSLDQKSTRLNSSHSQISYAVFCLKKKKEHRNGKKQHDQEPPTNIPAGQTRADDKRTKLFSRRLPQ